MHTDKIVADDIIDLIQDSNLDNTDAIEALARILTGLVHWEIHEHPTAEDKQKIIDNYEQLLNQMLIEVKLTKFKFDFKFHPSKNDNYSNETKNNYRYIGTTADYA
jgi:hypothetical protein